MIVWGSALHRRAPRFDWVEALCSSLERVRGRLSEWRGKPDLLVIAAGEAVKLALYATGYRGPWGKRAVLEALEAKRWSRLARFWRLYLEGSRAGREKALSIAYEAPGIAESVLEELGVKCKGGDR